MLTIRSAAILNCLLGLAMCLVAAGIVNAQDVPPAGPAVGPAVLQAFEQSLIDVVARCEGAVVAIARVMPEDLQREENPGDIFGSRLPPSPVDPSFIPLEFASGVILAREPDDGSRYVLTPRHVITGSRRRGARRRGRKARRHGAWTTWAGWRRVGLEWMVFGSAWMGPRSHLAEWRYGKAGSPVQHGDGPRPINPFAVARRWLSD